MSKTFGIRSAQHMEARNRRGNTVFSPSKPAKRLQTILQVPCYPPPPAVAVEQRCGQDRGKASPGKAQVSQRLLEPADVQDGPQSCSQGKFRFKAGASPSPHTLFKHLVHPNQLCSQASKKEETRDSCEKCKEYLTS